MTKRKNTVELSAEVMIKKVQPAVGLDSYFRTADHTIKQASKELPSCWTHVT